MNKKHIRIFICIDFCISFLLLYTFIFSFQKSYNNTWIFIPILTLYLLLKEQYIQYLTKFNVLDNPNEVIRLLNLNKFFDNKNISNKKIIDVNFISEVRNSR